MDWLNIVLQGVGVVVSEWISADAEQRAAIAQRALDSVAQMIDAGRAGDAAHTARTAATMAAIEAARGGK